MNLKTFEGAVMAGIQKSWFNNSGLDEALKHSLEGEHDAAERILESLDRSDPRVSFNLGWFAARKGDWKRCAELQDAGRWINVYGSPPLGAGTPIWNDEPLEGKTVLLNLEGGLGDEIMQVRWALHLARLNCKRVIVACSANLRELFDTQLDAPNPDRFVFVSHEGAKFVHHDYWIPGMSAPRWFGVDRTPYIRSPFPKRQSKLWRVGIRWSGNPFFEHEQHRRFPPEYMIRLASTPNTEFVSFQRDDNLRPLPTEIIDLSRILRTWTDTHEQINEVDLMITSCTSVAHLSAAMGKPTWIVVPALPYTPWAMPGDTSPWYANVRLYRQSRYGEWAPTFEKLAKDLEALCCK